MAYDGVLSSGDEMAYEPHFALLFERHVPLLAGTKIVAEATIAVVICLENYN